MNGKQKDKLTVSLEACIDDWWSGGSVAEGGKDIPLITENTFYLMAQSAVNILISNIEVENYEEE